MNDSEWYGEPHTLIVHSAHAPHGPLDDGCLDYDLEHPSACQKEQVGEGDNSYWEWTCDVAHDEGTAASPPRCAIPARRSQSRGLTAYRRGAGRPTTTGRATSMTAA